jgi:putative sterol carrier protein
MAYTSVQEVFNKISERFNPTSAKGLDAVCQFNITGEDGGKWYVILKEGGCQIQKGEAEKPTVTLTMPAETWLGMVNKQVSGMQAFMTGKLKVSGDIMLAQRIPDLFSM